MTKIQAQNSIAPPLGLVSKKSVVKSLGISDRAFELWGIEAVEKIGREKFFSIADIIKNRVLSETKQLSKKYETCEVGDDESLIPEIEQAKLARARREKLELELQKDKLEVFEVDLAEPLFAQIGAELCAILDSLPGALKRVMPTMTATQVNLIKKEINKAKESACSIPDRLDEMIDDAS